MELTDRLTTPGSDAQPAQPPLIRAGSIAGLILLASAGVLPLELGTNPVGYVRVSETAGTTAAISIGEAVSNRDILSALANLHDNMLASAVDLHDSAQAILYQRLWDLYE